VLLSENILNEQLHNHLDNVHGKSRIREDPNSATASKRKDPCGLLIERSDTCREARFGRLTLNDSPKLTTLTAGFKMNRMLQAPRF
jgi:hypothetical protein